MKSWDEEKFLFFFCRVKLKLNLRLSIRFAFAIPCWHCKLCYLPFPMNSNCEEKREKTKISDYPIFLFLPSPVQGGKVLLFISSLARPNSCIHTCTSRIRDWEGEKAQLQELCFCFDGIFHENQENQEERRIKKWRESLSEVYEIFREPYTENLHAKLS